MHVAGIVLLAGVLYFLNLDKGDLSGHSEGNYAEIPREMVESGDWVIPRLNYVPYLEKPPLFYWLTALSYKTLGVHAFSARLWSALPAMLLLLSVYAFVRRVRGPTEAWVSAVMLGCSAGMIAMARISYMDMLLCLCTAWVFMAFYLGMHSERSKKGWYLSGFLSLALAVLTKGLIGIVLPMFGIALHVLLQRRWGVLREIPWGWGLLLFFAVAAPWHVLAGARHDKFYWFYFVNEHWLRFLGRRMPKDYYQGAIYYQFLRLLLLFLPATLFLPSAFLKKPKEMFKDPLQGFLLCWVAAFLIFYTVSSAKANYYMMPAMPAMAMLVGLHALGRGRAQQRILLSGMGLLLLAAMAACVLLSVHPYPILRRLAPGSYPCAMMAAGIMALGFSFAFLSAYRARAKTALMGFAITVALASMPLFAQPQIAEPRGSVLPLVGLLESNLDPDVTVVLRGLYEKNSHMAFHSRRRFVVLSNQGDVGGDLDFGSRLERHRPYFIQWQHFLRDFGGEKKYLYVTMWEADFGELQGNHPEKCRLLGRVADRLLISNYPPSNTWLDS